MYYYFQHPKYTENEIEKIGEDEHEALETLQQNYDLDLEDVFNLTFDGYIFTAKVSKCGTFFVKIP